MPDYTVSAPVMRAPQKVVTFDGSAGGGAVGSVRVWTVTGRVLVTYLVSQISTGLSGGATAHISLGTSSAPTAMRATTSGDLNGTFSQNLYWETEPLGSAGYALIGTRWFFQVSENIIITVTTADVTGGALTFDAFYYPLTADGALALFAGVNQIETATIVEDVPGTLTAGDLTVIITAAGMSNSPKTVDVAVATDDTENQVAGKVRTALAADADVGAFFAVSGTNADIVLTANAPAANDGTMNIDIEDRTCNGVTTDHTSTNTQAGQAPG